MSKTKEDLFLTSVYFTEQGPFTKDELVRRACEHLFTWDMYILRLGETVWHQVRDMPEMRKILETHLLLKTHDTGPSGGFIIACSDKPDTQEVHYIEAAPCDVGFVSWDDAQRLCNEYSHNGFTGWRLPTDKELSEFAFCIYGGDSVRTTEVVWHWSNIRNGDDAVAVVTHEIKDYYQPRLEDPLGGYTGGYYISKHGPRIGSTETFPVSYWFQARPVRDFCQKKPM